MPEPFNPYRKWLGIRPEEQPANHYRLLGITLFEDDQDAIVNAAVQRMAHVRTFQLGKNGELSQRILNEIAAAKVCLLNAAKKAAYDEQLRKASGPLIPKPPPVEVTPVRSGSLPENRVDASDLSSGPTLHKQSSLHGKVMVGKSSQIQLIWAAVVVGVIAVIAVVVISVMGHNGATEPAEVVAVKPNDSVKPPPVAAQPTSAKPTQPLPNAKPRIAPKTDAQLTEVVPKNAPEPKPDDKNESLSSAQQRLEKLFSTAATANDYADLAKQELALSKRAMAENDQVIAKAAAKQSLVAARKSGEPDLVKQATLLLIQLPSQ